MSNDKHKTGCACNSSEVEGGQNYRNIIISAVLLLLGLIYQEVLKGDLFQTDYIRLSWYLLAYAPVAIPVFKSAWDAVKDRDFFNEFTLMSIATIGAFVIKEYPEAVAVMLFYAIGENLQDRAVDTARKNIRSLVGSQKKTVTVQRGDKMIEIEPEEVEVGETMQVRNGEKIALDGELLTSSADLDASALTGESVPVHYVEGMEVFSGMINKGNLIMIKVTRKFENSALSRIMALVEDASSRKSQKELLIRRFAKIYTPIVFALAALVVLIPYFFIDSYVFKDWLYRGLVLLVISCPCALVISVPLAYYAGIGAASKNGILFKGANFIDALLDVNTFVMDKTGTVTKGVFKVQEIISVDNNCEALLSFAKLIESKSTHPIAKAILIYRPEITTLKKNIEDVEERAGFGLIATVDNKTALAGNAKLMDLYQIVLPDKVRKINKSHVIFSFDGQYIGYIVVADEVKPDAKEFVSGLKKRKISDVEILSGDKSSIVREVGQEIGVDNVLGDLLPEQKLERIKILKEEKKTVAFVGDGINDTPAMALSDVGISMGKLGSDAAVEVADVIIQNDKPSFIIKALDIAKKTNSIVIINITFAILVKVVIIGLGIFGKANLWEAVFADVGVTLIAILNSMTIFYRNK